MKSWVCSKGIKKELSRSKDSNRTDILQRLHDLSSDRTEPDSVWSEVFSGLDKKH